MPSLAPTVTGYLAFIRNQAQIPTSALPDASPYIQGTFNMALTNANVQLACMPVFGDRTGPTPYQLAVYNLGVSNLINFAPDQPGAPAVPGSQPPEQYFTYWRNKWNLLAPISGVVSSSADESTSVSLEVIDQLKYLTLADLALMKDPYGRAYLNLASRSGYLLGLS